MNKVFSLLFLLLSVAITAQNKASNFKDKSFDDLKNDFFDNEENEELQHSIVDYFIKKAKKENNQNRLARGYHYKSILYRNDTKIVYFDSIINHTKTLNDKDFPISAYYNKGNYLSDNFRFDEALKSYIDAEKIAVKQNNKEYLYHIKFVIGILKSEKMGDVEDAIPLFKEFHKEFESKKEDQKYISSYQNSLFALADAYKSLNFIDSATYYNKKGYLHTKKHKNEYLNALFTLNEGANQILNKKYLISIDSINKSLPIIIKHKDISNTLAAHYYYGKAYEGLKNKKLALDNFKKVDSLYILKGTITPEFTSGYLYLIDYYKKSGEKEKQLLYTDKYMKIDSILQKNYKKLVKKIHNEYDIPHVIRDKQDVINNLNTDKSTLNYLLLLLIFFGLIFMVLFYFQIKLKKKYKQKFEELIHTPKIDTPIIESAISKDIIEEIGISNDVVNLIVLKFENFESQKLFLKQNISINSIAIQFETNSNYISKIVNNYKQKSFSNYINDLRIDYIVKELQTNKNLRKFTIAAIAEEIGFNNAESFSTAFYKKNQIKPSFFIKELNNLNSGD